MTNTSKLINEILQDFNGEYKNRTKKINFLKKISKSNVYISKKTGTIFHSPSISTKKILEIWSKKIYAKKINTKKIKYTSNNPIMRSRHYYSAIFINDFFKKGKKIKYCDYGTGEGNFGNELLKLNKNIQFNFTEHSPNLYLNSVNLIKKNSSKNFFSFNGSIEDSVKNKKFKNFDAVSLLWTLCNCVKPLEVLRSINLSLKNNGLLMISESSRILVPFKKPIYNFFVKNRHTENTHPWLFSFNSLSNLLEVSGFRIIKYNRYYDENDLVIVAKKMNTKKHSPKIKIDRIKKVENFLKQWKKLSYDLKKL